MLCSCCSLAPFVWRAVWQVKGYRRILFCQSVRDDVDGALGGGAWASLLPRMCEGRLVPTPWLNKVRCSSRAAPPALRCTETASSWDLLAVLQPKQRLPADLQCPPLT
jgi:hypothetical protein